MSSSGLTTGGGLLSSSGLTTGAGLLSSSGLTTGEGLLLSSGLTTGGALFGNLTVGGGLIPSSRLTVGEGGLLSSSGFTIGGGLLSYGGLRRLSSSSSTVEHSSVGITVVSSSTTISSLSTGNFSIGGLLSSGGLTTHSALMTGGGLLSSGGLTTGRDLFSSGSLTSEGSKLSSSWNLATLHGVDSNVQSSVPVTSGLISTSSPMFQYTVPLMATSSLLTSSDFSLGSGLMAGSSLSPSKSSPSVASNMTSRTGIHLDTVLIPTGSLVTSSGHSPSSGLLTAGDLKVSSGLSLSITSEAPSSTKQAATVTTSTVEWPAHVQAILDSSTFDINKFLSSLQATNYSHLAQQHVTSTAVSKGDDEVTGGVIMSSVSSSPANVTSDDDQSLTDDQSMTDDLTSSQSSLTDITATLVSSSMMTSSVTTGVTTPLLITSTHCMTTTIPSSTGHHAFTTVSSTELHYTFASYTSPLASSPYNYSSPLSSTASAPYAGHLRTSVTLQSSLTAMQGYLFTATTTSMVTPSAGVVSKASSSSLHTLSLEDLERQTSTPTLPLNLPLSAMVTQSNSSVSASSYTSSDLSVSSSHLLCTSRSAPLSSKYYTPLTTGVSITPSLRESSLTTTSTIALSTPNNVRRQIFPSSSSLITSPSSSTSRHSVSLVYSSPSSVTLPPDDIIAVKQLKALHTPSSVTLSKPCCVGDSVQTQIPITNSCERWIQCKAQVIQLYRDAKQVQ